MGRDRLTSAWERPGRFQCCCLKEAGKPRVGGEPEAALPPLWADQQLEMQGLLQTGSRQQDNYVRDQCGLLEINSVGPACLFGNPLSQFWSLLGGRPIAVTPAGLGLTLERRRLSSERTGLPAHSYLP